MSLQSRSVRWETSGKVIVDGVSVSVLPGQTVGLLGPNGSGKSTLLRLLAGVRKPSAGEVTLDGKPLRDFGKRALARRIAVVEQDVATDQDPTVRDVIDLGRIPFRRTWSAPDAHDDEAVLRAAADTDIVDLLERRYRTLSGGERQRVQIARALAQEPTDMLLDEPTNHLDIRHQLALISLISTLPVTSIVALHDLNLAATFCDEVVVLFGGRVVAAGPPATVLTEELVRQVYGVGCRITRDQWGLQVRFLPDVPPGDRSGGDPVKVSG